MLTTTRFPASASSFSLRWMASEAMALPPGLSTRRTTAFAAGSFRSSSRWSHSLEASTTGCPPAPPPLPRESTMAPRATTTLTVGGGGGSGSAGTSGGRSCSPETPSRSCSHQARSPRSRQCSRQALRWLSWCGALSSAPSPSSVAPASPRFGSSAECPWWPFAGRPRSAALDRCLDCRYLSHGTVLSGFAPSPSSAVTIAFTSSSYLSPETRPRLAASLAVSGAASTALRTARRESPRPAAMPSNS
mmetsp:Transcript_40089/g.95229  ORF Transcript_40089/g.95229 Transcript_40089/m.95229 type:complete len:247 (+) Transcript_40089:300-1040(+)